MAFKPSHMEFELNLGFKPTPFNMLLAALAQFTAYCHVPFMHHIVALHWLCSPMFVGICPLSVDDIPMMSSMTPMKSYIIFRSARQANPPCSFRYNPTLSLLLYFIALGQLRFMWYLLRLLEPFILCMTWHSTVIRWISLAWVGVVWALLCLPTHACFSCLLLLRVESGLIHRRWIGTVMNMSYCVWAKCVNTFW